MPMKLVVIESPYAGDVEANMAYARECVLDCLRRNEAPYASHLFYTQVLDDTKPEERARGMEAGFRWGEKADLVAVYTDRGVSRGMEEGIRQAKLRGTPIDFRTLPRGMKRHFIGTLFGCDVLIVTDDLSIVERARKALARAFRALARMPSG
jgi:hypothetical protein